VKIAKPKQTEEKKLVKKKTGNTDKGKTAKEEKSAKKETKIKKGKVSAKEGSPKKKEKKEKKNDKALMHLAPKNLIEQRDLFFANECLVNPIFEYENPLLAQKTLQAYSQTSGEHPLMDIAVKILDSFLETFGSQSLYHESEGDVLTQEETERIMNKYIADLGFQDELIVAFSPTLVAPTSCTYDPKLGKSKINVRLPCKYRRGRIMGVLDHEVGTHFLRRWNER
jgi:hypothetical protein